MSSFSYQPELPRRPRDEPFLQTIVLQDNDQPVGRATWHAPAGEQGVVQIVDLAIAPPHRRRGHGRRLFAEALRQAIEFSRRRDVPLRRVWLGIEQKSQIIARAFLTEQGLHHVATVPNLLRNQDALIYVKSLD
ncbi:MAG: GNAT family N-acetyltransferase [Tepidisphaeraceae bacterium]